MNKANGWIYVGTDNDVHICPIHLDRQDICCCHWNKFAELFAAPKDEAAA